MISVSSPLVLLLDKDLSQSFSSSVIDFKQLNSCSFVCKVTGTASGSILIKGCNHPEIPVLVNPDPSLIFVPLISVPIVGGLFSDNTPLLLAELTSGVRWLIFEYVFTSGSGTITVEFNGKANG